MINPMTVIVVVVVVVVRKTGPKSFSKTSFCFSHYFGPICGFQLALVVVVHPWVLVRRLKAEVDRQNPREVALLAPERTAELCDWRLQCRCSFC